LCELQIISNDGFVHEFHFSKPIQLGAIAMRASPLMSIYDHLGQASYEVRVRGTTTPIFLWGSAGIKPNNINFDKPLLLHIRNDVFGEVITFGTQVASGARTTWGTLQPGECVSIPLQDISGVFATCDLESNVGCLIKGNS
jgi:hypothetical protein